MVYVCWPPLRVLLLLLLLAGLIAAGGCERRPKPLKVAFIGTLTGRSGGLGIEGRDGFLLAVQALNAAGGVRGRPLEALVYDDGLDPGLARQALEQAIAAGAVAVVGPMTSQVAVALAPEADIRNLVLVSPTVSTDELSGRDDFFLRVYYTNAQAARAMAAHAGGERGLRRIAAIYNSDNRSYTEDWLESFRAACAEQGGALVAAVPFSSREAPGYAALAEALLAARPDGILLLANPVDTAMLAQQLGKSDARLPLFATGWSFSDDLLSYGGGAVAGLTLIHSLDPENRRPAFAEFETAFQAAYQRSPRFPAIHAFDATRLLAAGLERSGGRGGAALKEALLELGAFAGLQGELALDAAGDLVNPPLCLLRIEDGQARPLAAPRL